FQKLIEGYPSSPDRTKYVFFGALSDIRERAGRVDQPSKVHEDLVQFLNEHKSDVRFKEDAPKEDIRQTLLKIAETMIGDAEDSDRSPEMPKLNQAIAVLDESSRWQKTTSGTPDDE